MKEQIQKENREILGRLARFLNESARMISADMVAELARGCGFSEHEAYGMLLSAAIGLETDQNPHHRVLWNTYLPKILHRLSIDTYLNDWADYGSIDENDYDVRPQIKDIKKAEVDEDGYAEIVLVYTGDYNEESTETVEGQTVEVKKTGTTTVTQTIKYIIEYIEPEEPEEQPTEPTVQ